MSLAFSKYEGLGNDFVVVDVASQRQASDVESLRAQARAICDRHRGVGGDGVLVVTRDAAGVPRMDVINADGSEPEMCGNGIRCVALHLVRTGAVSTRAFDVDTAAGLHRCEVSALERSAPELQVRVAMRAPSLAPASLPVLAEAGVASVIEQPFDADGKTVKLTCVSMGNPHAVTFDELGEERRTLGPLLEKHVRFPRAANIGFARLVAPQTIELSVWERGVGFTEACGTGACASAVAAVETGRAERGRAIEVRLPGGPLEIVVGAEGERLQMTGPARHVFDGVY
jgi:diaminopimelate epimerase